MMKKNEYIHEREREKEREMLSQHCHTALLLLLLMLLLSLYMICVLKMKLLCSDVVYILLSHHGEKEEQNWTFYGTFSHHLRYTHFPKEQRRECLFAAAPDHRRTNAKSPSSS